MNRQVLVGQSVGRGVVSAPSFFLGKPLAPPENEPASINPEETIEQVQELFASQSSKLNDKAASADGELAEVLKMSASILKDRALLKDIKAQIDSGTGVVTAVYGCFSTVAERFANLGGYMAERVSDIHGLREQILALLLGQPAVVMPSDPYVLVAHDLSVAQTSDLDIDNVVAIVLEEGGVTGHTAIVAKQLGIPCLVQVRGVAGMNHGVVVQVDLSHSRVIWEPSETDLEFERTYALQEERLASMTGPGRTSDGYHVSLNANIGNATDLDPGIGHPEGVGLFRTEMFFLNRMTSPTLEEQVEQYAKAAQAFPNGHVVIRTLDAGTDKPVPYVLAEQEENPALGLRGNRLNDVVPEVLRTQLQGVSQAAHQSGSGELWAMAPMIATVDEARDFYARAREAGVTKAGVMVEIPSAALLANEILAEVDFVSIGTNDLAQYTMAADRLDTRLQHLLSPWQPGVLRLIKSVAEAGIAQRKPVGVCGESAGDPLMAIVLVGLGAQSLSMAPSSLDVVRYFIGQHSIKECREIAETVLSARTAESAHRAALEAVSPELRAFIEVPEAA